MKKRIIALIFAFCMVLNLSFVASANENTESIRVLASERIETSDPHGVVNMGNPPEKCISFNSKEYNVYEVVAPKAGKYVISMRCGVHKTYPLKTKVHLFNGESYDLLFEKQLVSTGGTAVFADQEIGVIELSEGSNIVKFENTYSDGYLVYIDFTLIPPLSISEVKANGKEVAENGTIARGTDCFDISLNQAFQKNTVSNDTVFLMGNEKIDADLSVNDNIIVLTLKETLDFETDYTLYIDGVESDAGVANNTFAFSTTADSAEDEGSASLGQTNIVLSSGVVSAKGVMYGSAKQTISGREVYLYLTDPNGNGADEIATVATTDSEGKYTLEYTLDENAPSGEYTITIGGEYIAEKDRVSENSRFVSPLTESAIIDGLKKATDGATVEEILNINAGALDINPTTESGGDLEGLENSDIIFANLSGKSFGSASEIRNAYYAEVLTAKINEAEDSTLINEILSSDECRILLGLDQDKYENIVSAYDYFVTEILALDEQNNAEDMKEKLSKLLDKALVEEYGLVPAEIATEDIDVYETQTVNIPLKFTASQMLVKGVKFNVTSEVITTDNSVFNGLESIQADVKTVDGSSEILFESDEIINNISSIGNFKIKNAPEGNYAISLKATVVVGVNGIEIPVETDEKIFNVTVHPKKEGFVYEDAAESTLKYELKDRTAWNCKEGVQTTGGIDHIGFHSGEWHEFTVDVPENGEYHFIVYAGVASKTYFPKLSISVAFENESAYKEIVNGVLSYTGAWTTFEDHYLGTASLSEGTYKIKVSNTYADAYFAGIKLTKASDIGVRDIKIGNKSLLVSEDVNRGSDVIEITFNDVISANSVSYDSVILSGEKGMLSYDIATVENKIILTLKETLDFEKSYSLKLNGVADSYNASTIENRTYTFTTLSDSDDEGIASISNLKGEMVYEKAIISGTLYGSQGQIMAGRKVALFIKDTEGNVSGELASATTDENGNFVINYSINENSPAGVYTFIFGSDYISSDNGAECKLTYVTKEQGALFLVLLKNTENASDVKSLLEDNEEMLMVDISEDIKILDNENKFYNHFVGKELSDIPSFFVLYEKALLTERINQTKSVDVIDDILSSEEGLELLGIEKSRYALLVNNKSELTEEIYNLSEITSVDKLFEKINELFEEALADEYSKPNSRLSSENTTIYAGYSAAVKLAFAENIAGAEEIVFIVTTSYDELLNDIQLKDVADGEISYVLESENRLKITFKPKRADRKISDIATLYLGTATTEGRKTINISGNITYPIENTDEVALASIIEKTITITVNKQTSGGSGSVAEGGSTRIPTGGGSSTVKPNDTPVQPPVIEPEKEMPFTDIEGIAWAKESILKLHELGIVSDSSDKKFNPNTPVKKEELVKMIILALDYELVGESSLKDVKKEAWYYQFIAASQYHGLIMGDDLGNFGIGTNLTRQDLCVIVARALTDGKYSSDINANPFVDNSDISDYAKEAVYWLRSNNLIDGVGENQFAPKNTVTRAMAAKLIASVLDYKNGEVK